MFTEYSQLVNILASDTTELRLSLEKRLVRVWLLSTLDEFVSVVYCRRPGDELLSRHVLRGFHAHMLYESDKATKPFAIAVHQPQ